MSWTAETNIKGPAGPQGPQGIQGPPGASGTGTGNVNGPAGAVADHIATYNGTSGTVIKDGGKLISDLALTSHTHTASQVTDFSEAVDDRVGSLLVAGTNITLNYNDPGNTLTINGTGSGAASGITVTPAGNIAATNVQAALVELDTEKVAKAGDTMTGNLIVNKSNPSLALQKTASGQTNQLVGYNDVNPRWQIQMGDSVAESGSDVGSNFTIARYSDAGAPIDAPLAIARSTGVVDFKSTPTVSGVPIGGGTPGGTPGGSTTQVQYNNAGAFGGAANLTWNTGTSVLSLNGQLAISTASGQSTSILAGGIVQGGGTGFKATGTIAWLAPETAGVVGLRPNGLGSSTGQLSIATTGAVTVAGPVNLPADPTTALQATTKQYVDNRAVRYDAAQGLTVNQMAQGRANIAVTKRNYIINGGMMISQENGSTASAVNLPIFSWITSSVILS